MTPRPEESDPGAGRVERKSLSPGDSRAETERFMELVHRHPELRTELESLGPASAPRREQAGGSSNALLPNIEPFQGLPISHFLLVTFMRYWSEELRAAQWYGELEFFLTTVGGATDDNPNMATENFQEAYRELIERAGGWYSYGADGLVFVPGTYEELLVGAARWLDDHAG